jgi:copper chaperone CopZ
MTELRFTILGAGCHQCLSALTAEISKVPGVGTVHLEHDTHWIVIAGDGFEIDAIRAAVSRAGQVAQLCR